MNLEKRTNNEGANGPEISIIVSAYNSEKYIKDCMDSLLNQDYSKEKYEVIVVDDGSTDGTKSLIKSYNGKIKYFYKENGGSASARNLGFEHAKGKYIKFFLHDN